MSEPPAGARTVTVGVDRLARWLDGFTERHGETRTTPGRAVVALTGSDGARAWIDVPFPPLADSADNADGLVEHACRARRVGVLLVRRGGYAVGIFDGTELVSSKVGSRYVQGTTKAGGWSQQRYARRRGNQAAAAFADAADTAARILVGERLDAFVAGGDRDAVRAVLTDRRLAHLEPTGPWLQVPDPRLRTLQQAPEQFRAVRVHLDP